jgi:hypothetical protein
MRWSTTACAKVSPVVKPAGETVTLTAITWWTILSRHYAESLC